MKMRSGDRGGRSKFNPLCIALAMIIHIYTCCGKPFGCLRLHLSYST